MSSRQSVKKTALLERSQAITALEKLKLKRREKAAILLLVVGAILTPAAGNRAYRKMWYGYKCGFHNYAYQSLYMPDGMHAYLYGPEAGRAND